MDGEWLEKIKQIVRRDDWMLYLVGSDIRQLVAKVEWLEAERDELLRTDLRANDRAEGMDAAANVFKDLADDAFLDRNAIQNMILAAKEQAGEVAPQISERPELEAQGGL